MRIFNFLAATACTTGFLLSMPSVADAQVSINIGAAPECPYGYYDIKGAMPNRGERSEPARRVDKSSFHGNEERDGRGHSSGEKR
jgi:hypothetical protein